MTKPTVSKHSRTNAKIKIKKNSFCVHAIELEDVTDKNSAFSDENSTNFRISHVLPILELPDA